MFDEYLKTTGKPIEASIRGELSGDFEKLMLAVGMSCCCILGLQGCLGSWPRNEGLRAEKRNSVLWRRKGKQRVGGELQRCGQGSTASAGEAGSRACGTELPLLTPPVCVCEDKAGALGPGQEIATRRAGFVERALCARLCVEGLLFEKAHFLISLSPGFGRKGGRLSGTRVLPGLELVAPKSIKTEGFSSPHFPSEAARVTSSSSSQ